MRPGGKYISTFWQGFPEMRRQGRWSSRRYLLKNLKRAVQEDIRQRTTIGSSRDTGYGMLAEFTQRRGLKAGVATPVFDPAAGFQPAHRDADPAPGRRLPARPLVLRRPRSPAIPAPRASNSFGYPDTRAMAWEEFLWKGEPFAFHVRGELHRKPIGRTDRRSQVLNKLNAMLEKMGRGADPRPTASAAPTSWPTEVSSWDHLDRDHKPKDADAPRDRNGRRARPRPDPLLPVALGLVPRVPASATPHSAIQAQCHRREGPSAQGRG
ncbi:MAG: hypothetical protein WDM92_13450 [Caulobacteraceae bacterium]